MGLWYVTLLRGDWKLRSVNTALSKPFYSAEFASSFEAMAPVLESALEALIQEGCISTKDEAATRLCLEEALVNAVRHGNQCDTARKVYLELTQGREHCTIKVRDEGDGFCPEQVKLPEADQLGGRGICLMRHYMDQVCFNRATRCLEMKFRRKMDVPAES